MTDTEKNMYPGKLRLFRLIMFAFTVLCILLIYSVFVVVRSIGLYEYIKSDGPGWRGTVYQSDPELGLAPVPGAEGAQIIPLGPDLPVRFDPDGFRIPNDDRDLLSGNDPSFISLGCSFTFGAGVRATDTYIFRLAENTGGHAGNAGVCSYGLVQMMLLTRELVSEYRPDYLVVQYSPWLVSRAMTPFAPSYAGRLPVPYFFEEDSLLMFQPPLFLSKGIELNISRYRETNKGFVDFLSFLINVGFPMYVHDDINMAFFEIGRITGSIPEPSEDAAFIIASVYSEIFDICEEYGTRLVILVLGRTHEIVQIPFHLFPDDAIIVNAHQSMLDSLDCGSIEEYKEAYGIWRGNPLQLVDLHPNERAHRIISEALIEALATDSI